jgi:hypothetical protein
MPTRRSQRPAAAWGSRTPCRSGAWRAACAVGPVSSPPFGAHAQRVDAGARPVESALAAELVQQQVVQPLPDASALPVVTG